MTAFSLSARLNLGVNSSLAFSLPQSRCFNPFPPRQLPPQREPRRLPPQSTDLGLLSKLGVDAIPCRGYNPSVTPTACQLPLHRGAENALSRRGAHRSSYARLWRADLIRHGAAPRRSPAPPSPRGRLRRRSKATPLRGSQGGSAAGHRFSFAV